MLKYLDLRPDQLMGRYGFIFGGLLLLAALVGLVIAWRMGRTPRPLLAALWVALLIGAVFFVPAAPRLAKAAWRIAFMPPPPAPSGPLRVAQTSIALPLAEGESGPRKLRLWFPAAAGASREALQSGATDCASLSLAPLADPGPQGRFPLLLYAPGYGNGGDDNASTAASLASHGYVIAAIDDLDHGKPEDPANPFFHFASQEAYEATLRKGAQKSVTEARVALAALDQLAACVSGDFAKYVDFKRVGFFGFSFGGSVAATAAILDPRIVAAANLDGWVFGAALEGGIEKPYLLLIDDEPLPNERALASPDPGTRLYAMLQAKYARESGRLFEQKDKYGYWVRNSVHANFNDQGFSRSAAESWIFADPSQVKAIRDYYLRAFFDAFLRGASTDRLLQDPSPFIGVTPLKGRPAWPSGEERVPILAWIGLR